FRDQFGRSSCNDTSARVRADDNAKSGQSEDFCSLLKRTIKERAPIYIDDRLGDGFPPMLQPIPLRNRVGREGSQMGSPAAGLIASSAGGLVIAIPHGVSSSSAFQTNFLLVQAFLEVQLQIMRARAVRGAKCVGCEERTTSGRRSAMVDYQELRNGLVVTAFWKAKPRETEAVAGILQKFAPKAQNDPGVQA